MTCTYCNGTGQEPGLDLTYPPVIRLKEVRPLVAALLEIWRLLPQGNPVPMLNIATAALDLPICKNLVARPV